jgi:uncharacterized protein YjiK
MKIAFSIHSKRSKVQQTLLKQHIRKSISTISVLILIATLVFPFLQVNDGSAQNQLSFIRQVRVMEADETGLSNPAGITFSTKGDAFHIADARQISANHTDLVKVTPLAVRAGFAQLAAAAQNPINMAFDNRFDRLLLLGTQGNQLLEVRPDNNGNLGQSNVTRYNVNVFGLQDPQGMAVDEETGTLFILDAAAPRVLQVRPLLNGSFEGASLSEIDLQSYGFSSLQGIAFEPASGHLFVIDPTDQNLYEVTASGELVATRDLAQFRLKDPQAIVFAPSGDQTDDLAQMSLYVADRGLADGQNPVAGTSSQSTGQIVELSLTPLVEPAAVNFTASLIRTTDMAAISPPSPDPSGIAYLPNSNTLLIVDGEVEETANGITHFQGANTWELTLLGNKVRSANISKKSPTVSAMTNEPTDVTWNPNNGHYYVTDDDGKRVFDLNTGGDGLIGTSDDRWTSFGTSTVGSGDPEGITFNTRNSHLFVADGNNAEVYEFTINGNLVNHFDVQRYGVGDPESIEFNSETGTLFTMSSNKSTPVVVETTIDGTLLQTINIVVTQAEAPAGLAYAPASNGSGLKRFYIVDRGIDNNDNPNIIDGKMYELTAPSFGPTVTPSYTFTPTNTPTITNTPTAGPTATSTNSPTNTSTPGPTFTPTEGPTATNTNTPTHTSTMGPTSTPTPSFTSTPTSSVPDLIFNDGFESGNFSAWSANSNNGGNLSISVGAALAGNYGLKATFTNTTNMLVRNDSPTAETRYRARFYFNPNSISMVTGDNITLLQGLDAGGKVLLAIQFNRSSTGYQLRARAYDNGMANFVNTPYFNITNAVHVVEVDWANDGHLTFWIDGLQQSNVIGINNSTHRIETLRLGAPNMSITGTSGSYYIDAFESRRFTYIGP